MHVWHGAIYILHTAVRTQHTRQISLLMMMMMMMMMPMMIDDD